MKRLPWWLTWLVLPAIILIVVGTVLGWLLKMLFGLGFYLVLGALTVGGLWLLFRKVTRGRPH